jgi:hypothetical protein
MARSWQDLKRGKHAESLGDDPPGRLQPVHAWHPDVHQDDVWPVPEHGADGLGPAGSLGYYRDAGLVQDHAESGPYQGLIIGDNYPRLPGARRPRSLGPWTPPGSG